MRFGRALLAVLVLVAPGLSRAASYLQDDVGLITTRATEDNPRSGALSDALSGQLQATEALALSARLGLTHERVATSPSPQMAQRFPALTKQVAGGNIALVGLAADFDATPHLSLGASADLSPKARSEIDTTLALTAANGTTRNTEAYLHSESSSLGATVSLTYDTADLDAEQAAPVELAFGLDLGATGYTTQQAIDATLLGEAELARRQAACRALAPKKRPAACAAILGGEAASVTQFPLQADVNATILEDNELGLAFTYFAYSEDPNQVGLFTVYAAGRHSLTSFGNGIPLAPELFSVRPDFGRQLGPVYADLFAEYAQYLDDEGHQWTVGLKLKWKVSPNWRLTAGGTFSRDVPGPALTEQLPAGDPGSGPIGSASLSAGVRYTF